MNEPLDSLIQRYRGKGVFVDSNLLLLWFVGALGKQSISQCRRTQQFVPEDFDTVDRFMSLFRNRVTSPHVLTEVSNLAKGLGDRAEAFFGSVFSKAVMVLREENVASTAVVAEESFCRFGLTDAAILTLVRGKYLLLTDDFRLSQYCNSKGGAAINFNHIRTLNWT